MGQFGAENDNFHIDFFFCEIISDGVYEKVMFLFYDRLSMCKITQSSV